MDDSRASNVVEYQAVIMAGGVGNRLYPLTEEVPKVMLPIANRPMLSFQLELLEKSGFTDVLVITTATVAGPVRKYTQEQYRGKIRIELFVLDGYMGTADALRLAKDKIKTDFFVLSGDMVTNVHLQYLADVHRTQRSAVAVLLKDAVPAPGKDDGKDREKKSSSSGDEAVDTHYIGLAEDGDEDTTRRLLFYQSTSDVEDSLRVSKNLLKRCPNLLIHTTLRDMHLYLFSHWVLDLLAQRRTISSIQGELLPYLVAMQYNSKAIAEWGPIANKREQHGLALAMTHSSKVETIESFGPGNEVRLSPSVGLQCHCVLAPGTSFLHRANTVPSYIAINRELSSGVSFPYITWTPIVQESKLQATGKSVQLGKDCLIEADCKVGDHVVVKRSVIGKLCKIGNDVKITDCILMDHVTVEDGCTLTGTVVCPGATVQSSSHLTNCKVGANFAVESETEARNETLCRARDED